MAGMMCDAGEALDQGRDARQRPQRRREPMRLGAGPQRAFDPSQLPRPEPRLAARPARRFQPLPPLGAPGLIPVIRGRSRHAQLPRHRGLRFAPREQPRGLEPARFQRSKIPTGSAARSWHESAWHRTREIH